MARIMTGLLPTPSTPAGSREPSAPLRGSVIGITADRRASEQAQLFERRGARVMHGPTITTEYLSNDDRLRAATQAVISARPDFLIATTGIGVRAWFESAQAWGVAADLTAALAGCRIAARGPKAAAAVTSVGLPVWATAASEQLSDVVAFVLARGGPGDAVAFQHSGDHDVAAFRALRDAGLAVLELPVYRWRVPESVEPAQRLIDAVIRNAVDAVTFTSAPAVANLVELAERSAHHAQLLERFNTGAVVAACIGPVCANAARAQGITRVVAPDVGRLGLLVRAVTDALAGRRRVLRTPTGSRIVVQGRILDIDGDAVELAPKEREVFDLLVDRSAVVGKTTLLRTVWGPGADANALEATIARLRRRLGPAGDALRAVRGRGYWLAVQPESLPHPAARHQRTD